MKDLEKLVEECKKDLDEIGIPYRTVRNWLINTRAKCRWGQCRRVSTDIFDISISHRLLQDDVLDVAAKALSFMSCYIRLMDVLDIKENGNYLLKKLTVPIRSTILRELPLRQKRVLKN